MMLDVDEFNAIAPDVVSLLLTLLGLATIERLAKSPIVSRRAVYGIFVALAFGIWGITAYSHFIAATEKKVLQLRRQEVAPPCQR